MMIENSSGISTWLEMAFGTISSEIASKPQMEESSTTMPSRACSSILDSLGPDDSSITLDIDPVLLSALMLISDEDLLVQANSVEKRPDELPQVVSTQAMRTEAEKDFEDWKQKRRLIRRLSRNDSWDLNDNPKRGTTYCMRT
jgi:hypothetical protein